MTLTYRLLKGAELTYAEGDNNIKYLDLKMKLASVAPAVTNDSSQGFTANESTWFNYTTGYLYLCTSATVGAAVWSIKLKDTTYTNSEIKTKYEANANTNAFTDAEKSKLSALNSANYIKQGTTGTTAARPTANLLIGQYYYDKTLVKPIWWNGTAWTDGMGMVV